MRNNLLKNKLFATTLLAGVASSMSAGVALAQDYTTGSLEITVVDETGAPVTGASVSIESNRQGWTRSETTNASGDAFAGRLPAGRYTIIISSPGANSITDETIRVEVGDSIQYDFVLTTTDELRNDVIVVNGVRTKGSSFNAAETGLTIDVEETFERIPLPRNLNALVQLAPGTVIGDSAFGSSSSISGSSAAENAFYINGMNITDFRNFLGASTVPFEFYQAVEVKSGGYQAEFGRSTGGVINAVTKSGGNEWHGGASVFYRPDELREDSPVAFGTATQSLNQFDQFDETEYNLWVSGPVIEDRLFVYGMYSPGNQESLAVFDNGDFRIDKRDDPFYGMKVDAILTDGHTLEWTHFSDDRVTTRNTYAATFEEDANGDVKEIESVSSTSAVTNFFSGGDVNIVKYTGNFTDWFSLSILGGRQTFNQTTSGSLDGNPGIYDSREGGLARLGNWGSLQVSNGSDERELFRADADFRYDLFGEHQLRVGVDQETLTAKDATIYSGGIYYRYFAPGSCPDGDGESECVRVRIYDAGGEFETEQTAFYIQDSWQVTDQFLLNLGLRNETFDNRNPAGETFTKIEDQLAPRVSAIYDVYGDGKAEVFGSYGRYYLPVATNTNIRLSGSELFTQDWYYFSSINADDTPVLEGDPFNASVFGDGSVPDTRSVVDQDLEPMFVDEFILGGRYRLDDKWSLSASYTFRSLESTLEDIAVDAAVNAYCDANEIAGCADIWTGFHSYVLTNPGKDLVFITDEIPGTDGFVEVPLSANDLGYPEASREYEALELTAQYIGDRLTLDGSWTISRSEGNYEGPVKSDNGQDDAGITTSFDQPGLVDGSKGLLPNHRAHKLKLFGNYEVTEQFNVGGNLQVSSPRKFGCIGVHPTDEFAQAYGAESFYCGGELTPRGSQLESDWIYDVDVNFVYEITTLPIGRTVARVDIFNVFNADSISDIREQGEDDGGGVAAYYGRAAGYQAPRAVRFGLSWEF